MIWIVKVVSRCPSPTFSLTQMYLSDSMVRELNPMLAALIPTLVSCKENREKTKSKYIILTKSLNYSRCT